MVVGDLAAAAAAAAAVVQEVVVDWPVGVAELLMIQLLEHTADEDKVM